ncbi:MAG: glycogen/starch synthase [Anaerolineaceae bacterium]|nr:glycogen/starch synthase [Anaerolineaceae bacterium]
MNPPTVDPGKVLRILFIVAEADPFIKVGGLGDVGGSLPRALRNLAADETGGFRLDVRLVIPFYGAIDQNTYSLRPGVSFPVFTAEGSIQATAYTTELDGLPVYLIAGPPIQRSSAVYSLDTHQDSAKFTFFSLAALELARQLDWKPDILHANDWHTALSIYALSLKRPEDAFFKDTCSVLTLHNLPFMGAGAENSLSVYGLPPAEDDRLPSWAQVMPLPLGLLTADRIVPVSPTYAREILTPEFGCSLEDFLQTRSSAITGILNGIDTVTWDPTREQQGVASYGLDTLDIRSVNKSALQARFSLAENPETPLLAFIGRMDPQKGVDLVIKSLRLLSELDWQAIILGTGVPALEAEARQLEIEFPDRVRSVIRFDNRLSHEMYAGADILMMPSRYEPCGLAQMIAMRYGCIPVARATGGLQDTVLDRPLSPQNTGFLFESASTDALAEALRRAMYLYQNKAAWSALQRRGMQIDFSWKHSAARYAQLYQDLIKARSL